MKRILGLLLLPAAAAAAADPQLEKLPQENNVFTATAETRPVTYVCGEKTAWCSPLHLRQCVFLNNPALRQKK